MQQARAAGGVARAEPWSARSNSSDPRVADAGGESTPARRIRHARETTAALARMRSDPKSESIFAFHELHAHHMHELGDEESAARAAKRADVREKTPGRPTMRSGSICTTLASAGATTRISVRLAHPTLSVRRRGHSRHGRADGPRCNARGPACSAQRPIFNVSPKATSVSKRTQPVRRPRMSDPLRLNDGCVTRAPAQLRVR